MIVQSLDGAWELRQVGSDEVLKARVPGCVHTDLVRAKKIEDPFKGDNESKAAWVHETDWEYSRSFDVSEKLLKSDRVYLECQGLDTFAKVSVNSELLAQTDNMYLAHRFDVTDKLRSGANNISIVFISAVNRVKPKMTKDPLMCPSDSIPGASYARKSPSQWGWDWAPKLPTSGIWRSIRLAGYHTARMDDLRIRQRHRRGGSVTLNIEVSLEKYRRSACSILIRLVHPDGRSEELVMKSGGNNCKCSIDVAKPKLWWPNGYGPQNLYGVEAALYCDDKELQKFSRRVGLRKIEIEQKKDSHGRSFTFVVNGVRVFAKGANWVPADQFPSRVSESRYKHLVSSAARANMNMLRVWGGGIYEDDKFYDLCDENGILVWQDFMFSCSLYPSSAHFIDNVCREVEFNVIRLRNHACLALWCGNNEMEWFLTNGWDSGKNARRREQYKKIFHDIIPSLVNKFDPDRQYWPSSPYSGKPFDDPNSPEFGDGHYWDVWHGRLPFASYRTQFHRFMSEFGFESLPALETCKWFAEGDDLNITSHVMECHQKNSAGNGLILHYLAQTFRFPKNFEMTCYVSQLLQAEAVRVGVEHWRRSRGRCMGTLYWQLNDCWPASSWSSVDYFGRWKALHYFAKRFYAPVLLSVGEDGTKAELHVTNDTPKAVRIEVRWALENFDGEVIRRSKIKIRVDAQTSKRLTKLDFSDELAGPNMRRALLVYELLVNGKRSGLGMTAFVPIKHLDLPSAKINIEVGSDDNGQYVELCSPVAARFVYLHVPRHDVLFSDNFFDLPAGRKVKVRVESSIDDAALAKIRAYSVRDSY